MSGSRISYACGYLYTRDRLIAFPYDCAVAMHLLPPGPVRGEHARTSKPSTATVSSSPRTSTWKNVDRVGRVLQKGEGGGQGRALRLRPASGLVRLDDAARHPALLFAKAGGWIQDRRQLWLQEAGQDQLGRRAVDPDDDEVQGAGRRLPSRQPRQWHARAQHRLSGGQHRDADAVSRVRRLDRGREDRRAPPAARPPTRSAPRAKRAGSRTAATRSTAAIAASAASASTAMPRRTSSAPPISSPSGRYRARTSSTSSRALAARRPASRCSQWRRSRRPASGRPRCRMLSPSMPSTTTASRIRISFSGRRSRRPTSITHPHRGAEMPLQRAVAGRGLQVDPDTA